MDVEKLKYTGRGGEGQIFSGAPSPLFDGTALKERPMAERQGSIQSQLVL